MATLLRSKGDTDLATQRAACDYAGRPQVVQTPGERALELIARITIAKQHRNRAAFDAAKAELATLIESLN